MSLVQMPGTCASLTQTRQLVGLGEGDCSEEAFIYLAAPSNSWITQLPVTGFGKCQQILECTFQDGFGQSSLAQWCHSQHPPVLNFKPPRTALGGLETP